MHAEFDFNHVNGMCIKTQQGLLCFSEMCYFFVWQVSGIRNQLSHMSLQDSMNVSDAQMDQFFSDMNDLVTCLKNLKHINDLQRDTMNDELNKVTTPKSPE